MSAIHLRDLPYHDSDLLKTLTRKQPGEDLDASVVDLYWRFKVVSDRGCQEALSHQTGVLIVLLAGAFKPLPEDNLPPTVTQLYNDGSLRADDLVEVQYRGKPVQARFKSINGVGDIVVDIDGTERPIKADKVKAILTGA
jgi:hypothetical protein